MGINEWMDERMNEWMDEWMDQWMNGSMNGWMDEWINELKDTTDVTRLTVLWTHFLYHWKDNLQEYKHAVFLSLFQLLSNQIPVMYVCMYVLCMYAIDMLGVIDLRTRIGT